LNSDLIRSRYGSYGVELLQQNDTTRLANLFSGCGDQKVCRTLAVTRFLLPRPESLNSADAHIRLGASIGATLREAGWAVAKSDTVHAVTTVGQRFLELAGHSIAPDTRIGVQLYTLAVNRGNERCDYAVIAEAYHPDHIPAVADAPDLRELLEQASESRAETLSVLLAALEA